jgi:NAD(P)-dependent dehydrogenase (short-subunit alcohol dehydrogenase family)
VAFDDHSARAAADQPSSSVTGIRANQLVAVVTGANRGRGLEVCRQLADLDHLVVLGPRDAGKGHAAAASLQRPEYVTPCQLDVTDDTSVLAAAGWVAAQLGRCDVLVNNAAILYDTWARAESADLATVRETLGPDG